jgi:hypothetical protein
MRKEFLFWPLVAALLWAAPCNAGSYLVTTDVTFAISNGGTADAVEVRYTPSQDPVTNLAISNTNRGGLLGLLISEIAMNPQTTIETTFMPSGGTVGTLEWTFQSNIPLVFYNATALGVPAGDTVTLVATVKSVPEPAALGLFGIGLSAALLWQRLHSRIATGFVLAG